MYIDGGHSPPYILFEAAKSRLGYAHQKYQQFPIKLNKDKKTYFIYLYIII